MKTVVVIESVGGKVVDETHFLGEERAKKYFAERKKELKEKQGIWFKPYMLSIHAVSTMVDINGERKEVIESKPIDFARFGWSIQ